MEGRYVQVLAATMAILTALEGAVSAAARRFEGVSNHSNPFIASDGRALALFMDLRRIALPPSPASETERILTAVAVEGATLIATLEPVKVVLRLDRLMFEGKPLQKFVLIAVYPKRGFAGSRNWAAPVTFSPGTIAGLRELTERFGSPSETEIWSSALTRQIGLDGTVSWWGAVGVVTTEGSISHVLVRSAVDFT